MKKISMQKARELAFEVMKETEERRYPAPTIDHKAIFRLIEPEGIWRENGHTVGFVFYEGITPDFTLPEWRVRLQEWLFAPEQDEFLKRLYSYVENLEFVPLFEWQLLGYICNNLPALLTEYMDTEECKEEFGTTKCTECMGDGLTPDCEYTICNGSGRIPKPWLKAKEEAQNGF